MLKNLIAIFILTSSSQASSYIECTVKVELISINKSKAKIKFLNIKHNPDSFSNCSFIMGDILKIKIENYAKYNQQDPLFLKYMSYSAMGENGPIHLVTWNIE